MSSLRIYPAVLFLIFTIFQSQASSADLSDFDVEAIKATVKSQLQAFAEDDFDEAFKYAAPSIKKIFSSSENFRTMVINQYPAVYRPKKTTFGDIITYRNGPALNVFLVDPDGNFVTATYMMEKQDNNDWLIAGCILSMSAYEQI
ncbi:DUF4864 domain-containing protein [Pelagibacteraceae bacterium]|jgi:hypothetical protein|nr:DUF4864 domain-containing protein [Pelagibacteraceae bacterium]|tara:strand:- start:54 stop:488 length:435 start_codon:yes stop_codon:yes gene_type:complete